MQAVIVVGSRGYWTGILLTENERVIILRNIVIIHLRIIIILICYLIIKNKIILSLLLKSIP